MRPHLLHFLLVAAVLAPASAAAADPAGIARQEARLATIGWRLTSGGARWCPEVTPQPGWILGDLRRFDKRQRAAAKLAYGTSGDGPFVAAMAPGSPADRAGLVRGTAIAAIDGQPVPTFGDGPTVRIDAVQVMLAAREPSAPLTVTDAGGRRYELGASAGCASGFRIERSGKQAAANGKLVRLALRLAASVVADDELAAVVAHELAHNVLRHPAQLAASRSTDLVRRTEIEADRLSVWLLADAGYDPRAAIRFWERHKKPLIRATTHPPRRERIAAIAAEIEAMTAARSADPAARPPLVAALAPLE
ncbi:MULTISPECIES: M48 family metalloprotease [unclassified Sphingopyxis]|uniref:M48 family metalloprotease n=1 Tax=unclassified Sphingopyxis TaxID=2614943 RepID=UPI0007363A8C|nr:MULTISPECIES: M48 family metalloprotease [unclassified Sphingopyxis]KTE38772.1 hypothetical protein ATE62_10290 [Sphingopyxis sp. HIX]KTE83280.1 hypothetical protein ATE72_14915 [Sphingopyxis sp. HXXIV]